MANRQPLNNEIEDDLLSDIPGFEDTTADTGTDVDTNTDDNDTGAGDDQQQAQQPTDTAQTTQTTQETDPNNPENKPRYDKDGNVLDARGNIVARAGRERRLDEQLNRTKSLVSRREAEIVQLKQQLAGVAYLNNAPQRLGLTQEETAAAMDMMNMFKRNPAQLVQVVLAEAQARGVDLNRILGANVGAINTQAIKQMLSRELAPIAQVNRQRAIEQHAAQSATERYEAFMSKYPDAEANQDAIAELMRTGKASNEVEAYYQVREFALQNRLDVSRPLGPQIAARVKEQQQQQPQQRRPMVTGPGIPANRMTPRETKIASPDRSWNSIVDEAMAESGFNP